MSYFGHCANSCIRRILDEVTTAAENLGREKEVNDFVADAKEFITSYVAQVFAVAGPLNAYHSAFFNTMLDVNATFQEITVRLNEPLKTSSTEIPRFLILLHLNGRYLARKAAEAAEDGNPGTGKTTVARLLSGILKRLGILSKGHLVEIDRSGLVGGYIGQTAIKVKEVTDKAMGGVLFIDEAYSLASKCEWDFGREAVETLLKTMEDHRDDLVIIAAGYTEKMQEFLDINPGLRSRFNKFIHFQDYSPEELFQIFSKICADSGYEFTPEFSEMMRENLTVEFNSRGKDFANARAARNLFERVVANHSNRLAGNTTPSDKELITFRVDDINALARREVQKMEKRLV